MNKIKMSKDNQDLGRKKFKLPSLVEFPISVTGESSCGQADSLLVSRLLRPRQKVLNMDTDILLDIIKLIYEGEEEIYVPY